MKSFIMELGELKPNWDGYGGLPLCNAVIDHVLNIIKAIKLFPGLPNPIITPKSNGTISITWEFCNGEGYIEIGNTRFSGYLQVDNYNIEYFQGLSKSIGYDIIEFIYFNLFKRYGKLL